MKLIDRIDRQILIKPKRRYVTVEYDALYWGILELSSDAVEAIYNFAKTLPLQRSSMHLFSGRSIAIDVLKAHEQELADFIRAVARSEFSDILDQFDASLMREYRKQTIKKPKCPGLCICYSGLMHDPFKSVALSPGNLSLIFKEIQFARRGLG
jgi:hypothetical protein